MTAMQTFLQFFGQHQWMIHIFIVVLVTVMVHAGLVITLRRFKRKAEHTDNIWDNVIVYALQRPLALLIWLLGLSYAIEITGDSALSASQTNLLELVGPTREVGCIVLVTWALYRFTRKFEYFYMQRALTNPKLDKTSVRAIGQIVRATIIITASLICLQSLGIKLSVLLTLSGFGGIAAGFAAKDTVANFFGGLMIYFERPFKIGDWIRSPDKNIEGTVENIGWRSTCIRTFDKRPLYVPNGVFSVIAIENPSRMTNRRIKTIVGVRYDDADKLKSIIEQVDAMLRQHPDIDQQQTTFVNMVNFGESALEFMIYTFTKTTNWVEFQAVQQDVFLKVIDIILAAGAECAYPTRTLHINHDSDKTLHESN